VVRDQGKPTKPVEEPKESWWQRLFKDRRTPEQKARDAEEWERNRPERERRERELKEEQERERRAGGSLRAAEMARYFVKQHLAYPSESSFPWMDLSKEIKLLDGGEWLVVGTVETKNAFGVKSNIR
jgi:hypothetical protein